MENNEETNNINSRKYNANWKVKNEGYYMGCKSISVISVIGTHISRTNKYLHDVLQLHRYC